MYTSTSCELNAVRSNDAPECFARALVPVSFYKKNKIKIFQREVEWNSLSSQGMSLVPISLQSLSLSLTIVQFDQPVAGHVQDNQSNNQPVTQDI